MEHGFGSRFTVGIEDELLLVDPDTHALHHGAEQLLPAIDVPEGMAAHEAYACEIELRSPPSATATEAAEALARGRAAALQAGATLLAAGLHPSADFGDVRLVDAERYHAVERSMRGLIRRTPECALHVHVGMPDAEAAIRAFNGLRGHLPVLAGLAAGSPFWFGADSGLASARSAMTRAYPGRGAPPAFRDFADYQGTVESVTAMGGPENYTLLWWDVRPHPLLGTVEVREMDAQPRLEDAAALAALIQGLAAAAVERPQPPAPTEAIGWSSFRATRDGVEAEVLLDGSLRPLPEVARRALDQARPYARELGSDDALAGVERIIREGGGARRQRAVAARSGVAGLVDGLVQETAASAGAHGSSPSGPGR
jgi:glutamate---cysteine ligase / carboxylate-amine ligase